MPDPAVTAAAAIMADDGWTCDYHDPSEPCSECDKARAHTATAIAAAARPIIEAEVRERIAADIEAEVRERIAADIEAEFQHIVTFGGAEPPAFMDATQRSAYDLGYHDGAARIARGQS